MTLPRSRLFLLAAVLVAGALAGYLLRGRPPAAAAPTADVTAATVWTCSMHPEVRLPKPGLCPKCGMDLIPVTSNANDSAGPRELVLSPAARQLANVQVQPVERRFVSRAVRLVGLVEQDETRLATITAWVGGRLDRLFVDYTGITVARGDHLVSLYSPAVLSAQQELLQAKRAVDELSATALPALREAATATYRAARDRLLLWGLTEAQLAEFERQGQPSDHITLYAPTGGIVVEKLATEGEYVETGTPIYRIADLTQVWVKLDAYESDLPWLRYGQRVDFTAQSLPGQQFSGTIAFIDPVLTRETRTVKVRVNVPNPGGLLKPGMFVSATVQATLSGSGQVLAPDLAGKWISPMHPEIVKDGPGSCDVCGMALVKAEALGYTTAVAGPAPLVIPATAPLLTGTRAVVYVQAPDDPSRYEGREVVLGPRAGDAYVVLSGLTEGELVVVHGNFRIDSSLQILAKPSMLNPPATAAAPPPPPALPAAFTASLGPLLTAYLDLQRALAADQLDAARAAAAQLAPALAQANHGALAGDAHHRWGALQPTLERAIAATRDAADIEELRTRFDRLSAALIRLHRELGPAYPEPLALVHCPMAFDDVGADWLQLGSTVDNPYFGARMRRCGTVKETFPAAPAE